MNQEMGPTQTGTQFNEIARRINSGVGSDEWIFRLLDSVSALTEEAADRLCLLVHLYYRGHDQLPKPLVDDIAKVLLGFPYNSQTIANGALCEWEEATFIQLRVCEFLVGQMLPEANFSSDSLSGNWHRNNAAKQVNQWLADKYRFGVANWLSGTKYQQMIAGLTLLAEHGQSVELTCKASMVLDLLLADLAMHSFENQLSASAGSVSEKDLLNPAENRISEIIKSAFTAEKTVFDPEWVGAIFLDRKTYQVPKVLVEMAITQDRIYRFRQSFGLDVAEVARELRVHPTNPRVTSWAKAKFFWSMGATCTPKSIRPSIRVAKELNKTDFGWLDRLKPLLRLPEKSLPLAIKALNPSAQGEALQRANVQTFRTPHYMLSSAQRYQPGKFGFRQHIWQATLENKVRVFANHPHSTSSKWVGNQILPDVAQYDAVLLASYDLSCRRGFGEGKRNLYTHLHFPFVDMSETKLGETFVAGRSGDSYIGVVSLSPLEMISDYELIQHGVLTGYGVVLADRSEHPNLSHFANQIKSYKLIHAASSLILTTGKDSYKLVAGGEFLVNGKVCNTEYARLESSWAPTRRCPNQIKFNKNSASLELDWLKGSRTFSS